MICRSKRSNSLGRLSSPVLVNGADCSYSWRHDPVASYAPPRSRHRSHYLRSTRPPTTFSHSLCRFGAETAYGIIFSGVNPAQTTESPFSARLLLDVGTRGGRERLVIIARATPLERVWTGGISNNRLTTRIIRKPCCRWF